MWTQSAVGGCDPQEVRRQQTGAADQRTIDACRKHGKHVGVGGLAGRADLVAEFVKMGARYVSTGTDLGFLLGMATQKAKQVKDLKT